MKKIILISIISCLFVSCDNTAVLRENTIIVHKNFLVTEKIPFDLSKSFEDIKLDTINIELLSKEGKYQKLEPKIAKYFIEKYVKTENEFFRITLGSDAKYVLIDSTKFYYSAFAFGKIKFHNNINGYLVLLQQKFYSTKNKDYFKLVLYNEKNNEFQSTVSIFNGSKDSYDKNLTKFKDGIFSSLHSFYGPKDMAYDADWLNIKSWYELKLKLGIESYQHYTIYYSNYYIDDIGFLRFTYLLGYKQPEIVKEEIKRISHL